MTDLVLLAASLLVFGLVGYGVVAALLSRRR
jgi:hypothetical protein